MNTRRSIRFAVAAMMIVAIVSPSYAGNIGAVQKYRAPQITATDVILGPSANVAEIKSPNKNQEAFELSAALGARTTGRRGNYGGGDSRPDRGYRRLR